MLPPLALALLVLLLSTGHPRAKDFRAEEVRSLDGDVQCIVAEEGWITNTTGPCHSFAPPQAIRLGTPFEAEGESRTIGAVIATQHEKDFPSLGLKEGEWSCVAAEEIAQIPGFSGRDPHTGVWLYVPHCAPVR